MLHRPPWRRRLPLRCQHTPLQSVETLAPAVPSRPAHRPTTPTLTSSSSSQGSRNSGSSGGAGERTVLGNAYSKAMDHDQTAQWLFRALLLRTQLESNAFFCTDAAAIRRANETDGRLRQLMAVTESVIYSPSLATAGKDGNNQDAKTKSNEVRKHATNKKKGDKRRHAAAAMQLNEEVAQQQEKELVAPLQTALVQLVLLQAQSILPLTEDTTPDKKPARRGTPSSSSSSPSSSFSSSSFSLRTELVARLVAAQQERENFRNLQLLSSLLPHQSRLHLPIQEHNDARQEVGPAGDSERARRGLHVALTLERVLNMLQDGASCLPLLLYCRAHGTSYKPLKRWLSLAADCLCSMPARTLLVAPTLAAAPLDLVRGRGEGSSPAAGPFGEFAAVLSNEFQVLPLSPWVADGSATTTTATTPTSMRTSSTPQSYFSPYARMALQEMVACGGAALQQAAADPTASSIAVGAYLACRRFMGALPRHQRLRPLLELYELVMGPPAADPPTPSAEGAAAMGSTPQQWRAAVLDGAAGANALLWREMVLFDAYTLISVGHVSSGALDLAAGTSAEAEQRLTRAVQCIQTACQQHLQVLNQLESSSNGNAALQRVLVDLTPNTRQDLVLRLQEGLRLSTKYLLRIHATEAIRALYTTCPEMGGSWEVGQALLRDGDARGALAVLENFLSSARQTFAGGATGLPSRIQDLILETLQAVGADYQRKVVAITATCEPDHLEAALRREVVLPLLKEQETMHALLAPLRPALCFDALLKGLLSTAPTSSSSSGGSGKCSREQLYTAASVLLVYFQTRASLDGLVVSSVDALIHALVTYVSAEEVQAASTATSEEEAVLEVLSTIGGACPHLPIAPHALSRFTQAHYERGVRATLAQLLLPSADGSRFTAPYIQQLLAVLPAKVLTLLRSFLHPAGVADTPHGCAPSRSLNPTELYREQHMMDMVAAAVRARQEEDAQQLPWKCFLCQTWNSRFATHCKLCRAKRVAVVQCARCSCLSATDLGACRVCGLSFLAPPEVAAVHTTAGAGGAASQLDRRNVRAVFPLRPWTCRGCHHANDAEHALLCDRCGSPSSAEVSALLKETAYTCATCGHDNAQGALRPWCVQCGALSPAVAAASQAAPVTTTAPFLWQCVQCFYLSPSLSARCEACGGAQPTGGDDDSVAAAPLLQLPWQLQHCPSCGTAQSLNATQCRHCSRALEGLSPAQQQQFAHACQAWLARVRVAPSVSVAVRPEEGGREGGCRFCGAAAAARRAGCCTACGAYVPGTSLWVCLQPHCGGLNYEVVDSKAEGKEGEQEEGDVCCAQCGAVRTAAVAVTAYSDVLGYRPPPDSAEEVEGEKGRQKDRALPPMVPRALLLPPPPVGPRHCATCGAALQHPLDVCTRCGHVGMPQEAAATSTLVAMKSPTVHNGWRNLQGRLLLSLLEVELQRFASPSTSTPATTSTTNTLSSAETKRTLTLPNPTALHRFAEGVLHFLSSLPEADVPWRGCDVDTAAHLCGALPRLAVLADADETVHSAVRQMRAVVERLCDMAVLANADTDTHHNRHTHYASAAWQEDCRPWLALAVRAVQLMNDTTDYDELGWPTLSRLCGLVRPPTEAAAAELRWIYLQHMKLPMEAMVLRREAMAPEQRKHSTTNHRSKKKSKRVKSAEQAAEEGPFWLCPSCLHAHSLTREATTARWKCSCGYTWSPDRANTAKME